MPVDATDLIEQLKLGVLESAAGHYERAWQLLEPAPASVQYKAGSPTRLSCIEALAVADFHLEDTATAET